MITLKKLQTFILFLIASLMGMGSAWAADVTWDFSSEAAQTAAGTITADISNTLTATDGSSTITYVAGSSDKYNTSGGYYLYPNGKSGTSNGKYTNRYFCLHITESGKISFVGANTATKGGNYVILQGANSTIDDAPQKGTVANTAADCSYNVNIADGAYIFVAFSAQIYTAKLTWSPTSSGGGGTPYTVTFNANSNGTCATSNLTEASAEAGVMLPSATGNSTDNNNRYVFTGWNTAANGSGTDAGAVGATYYPSGNIELFAQYKQQFWVSASVSPAEGGSVVMRKGDDSGDIISNSGEWVDKGTDIWKQATANTGYTFSKWSGGSSSTNATHTSTNLSSVKNFTANFEADAPSGYTVTYDANLTGTTGSVPVDGNTYAENDEVTVLGNTGSLAKDGYTFLGWSTASGYQSSYYTAGDPHTMGTANVTLYAQWKINGSISSSPAAGSSVTAGEAITTTASSSATITGMYISQAGGERTKAELLDTGAGTGAYQSGSSASWGVSGGATLGTDAWTFYALLTDGTFYSDVLTNVFSVGVAAPAISCASNTVTITCATEGASIYYTTDDSEPTSGSTLYSAPFAIGENTTVNAIAIKSGVNSTVTTENCTYGAAETALPVTFDFSATPFTTSYDFSGSLNNNMEVGQNNHNIYFRGSTSTDYEIVDNDGQMLQMSNNGAKNRFIAIPISGINGRIDIDVWAPYAKGSGFTIRAYLATGTTTLLESVTSDEFKSKQDVNDYNDTEGCFNFRKKDITETEGVLYIGVNSSSYKYIEKIRITTPASYLVADKSSVTLGDAAKPDTVTVSNYTQYNAIVKPGYDEGVAEVAFNPSTGELVITPVAAGSTTVTLVVDENTNGSVDAGETKTLEIPVTVNGINVTGHPASACYTTGTAATPLTVTAARTDGGARTYQWYKNDVNSNSGGTPISGATSATLAAGNIDTSANESSLFYYCVVSADGMQSKASDVAYILTSSSARYFHMSNKAGNMDSSATELEMTGVIVAGGKAYMENPSGLFYRYITRPSSSVPHMYVADSGSRTFKVTLDKAITSTESKKDIVTVTLNGYLGDETGIIISDEDGHTLTISTGSDTSVKTYYKAFPTDFNGATTLYIKGIYSGTTANYFTDLQITEGKALTVNVTPSSQTVQVDEAPNAFTATATGGAGDYTYQWKQDTSSSGTFETDASGTGATTATFTPASSASAGTTYYKCVVTDGAGTSTTSSAVSVEVTALTHGYYTPSFTDNKSEYILYKEGYTAQVTTPATETTCYFDASNIRTWGTNNKENETTIDGIDDTNRKYPRITNSSGNGTIIFYVKNAVAFSIMSGRSSDRTYDVYVDNVKLGTCYADQTKETQVFTLNKEGSEIKITNPSSDLYIGRFTFYEKSPATLSILENGEEVSEATMYVDDSTRDFEVSTNGDGEISYVSSDPSVATVAYDSNTGVLTVTKVGVGTATITVSQAAGTLYGAAEDKTLTVTVKKHTLALAFSYDKASFKASALNSVLPNNKVIPSGSLPVLTATLDGEELTDAEISALGIKYVSDDPTVGKFDSDPSTAYTVKYGGGQGGARIYAYVDADASTSSARAYFDLVVENGTSNALPNGRVIMEQDQFRLANSAGIEVVRLTYGGYRYKHENGWRTAEQKGNYYIDGYKYYTQHGMDALDEYGYQLRGMDDEALADPSLDTDHNTIYTDSIKVVKSKAQKDEKTDVTFTVCDYKTQNVGKHSFWYTTSETKPGGGNYGKYERIRPFTLPCRGGYLKFEPKQTGKLTVYVYQNGTYSGGALGSKPRLGYWFDQDGWVQHPVVAPVTKQPLSEKMGSNTINLTSSWSKWTTANDDDNIKKLLQYKYCSVENPTESTPAESFRNTWDEDNFKYENPYYWMTESEIATNLDEEATIISKKMTPVPYHNGYLVPEASHLKYVLNVVAGKTYYFYGMMTKVGYVGMNFVEDESVIGSFAHEGSLHLNADDDMVEDVVSNQPEDYTVYDEVTLPSNYKPGQWSTICLPFALSESQVEEAFGKGTELTLYNGARKKGTGVYSVRYLSHVDRNILAGQPYFIKPTGVDAEGNKLENVGGVIGSAVDGQDGTRITFNTVCIDKAHFNTSISYGSDADVDVSGDDLSSKGYKFVGSYYNDLLPKYSYVVSGGQLRRYSGSTTKIPTYYAYLTPNTTASQAGSYSLQVDFSDDTMEQTWVTDGSEDTPTETISLEALAEAMNNGNVITGKAYNMMGQEVDFSSAKGMVIVNGKKYIK